MYLISWLNITVYKCYAEYCKLRTSLFHKSMTVTIR